MVFIIGNDKTMRAKVAGTRKRDVYFTDDAKTVFKSFLSFDGSSFEKAGNRTVCIGYVKKVKKSAKLVAILKLPIIANSVYDAIKKL